MGPGTWERCLTSPMSRVIELLRDSRKFGQDLLEFLESASNRLEPNSLEVSCFSWNLDTAIKQIIQLRELQGPFRTVPCRHSQTCCRKCLMQQLAGYTDQTQRWSEDASFVQAPCLQNGPGLSSRNQMGWQSTREIAATCPWHTNCRVPCHFF